MPDPALEQQDHEDQVFRKQIQDLPLVSEADASLGGFEAYDPEQFGSEEPVPLGDFEDYDPELFGGEQPAPLGEFEDYDPARFNPGIAEADPEDPMDCGSCEQCIEGLVYHAGVGCGHVFCQECLRELALASTGLLGARCCKAVMDETVIRDCLGGPWAEEWEAYLDAKGE